MNAAKCAFGWTLCILYITGCVPRENGPGFHNAEMVFALFVMLGLLALAGEFGPMIHARQAKRRRANRWRRKIGLKRRWIGARIAIACIRCAADSVRRPVRRTFNVDTCQCRDCAANRKHVTKGTINANTSPR